MKLPQWCQESGNGSDVASGCGFFHRPPQKGPSALATACTRVHRKRRVDDGRHGHRFRWLTASPQCQHPLGTPRQGVLPRHDAYSGADPRRVLVFRWGDSSHRPEGTGRASSRAPRRLGDSLLACFGPLPFGSTRDCDLCGLSSTSRSSSHAWSRLGSALGLVGLPAGLRDLRLRASEVQRCCCPCVRSWELREREVMFADNPVS
jgi:hypothetical protein